MAHPAIDRAALAEFLRHRREGLRPSDVGLLPGLRRRAPGLRREEVAQLATMSTDYYTRLEQRRGPQPSTQMLGALARALRLTPDERDYLYRVAGHEAPGRYTSGAHVAPALLRVLDRLSDTPAFIVSNLAEPLAQNRMAIALLGEEPPGRGLEHSGIFQWFTAPDTARGRYPAEDRPRQSRSLVASLRAAYGAMGQQSPAGRMVGELQRRSPEFTELWERQEVAQRFADHKVIVHPELGPIELDCQALFTEDQTQTLVVLTAAPRSEAEEKLRLLAVVGAETFG